MHHGGAPPSEPAGFPQLTALPQADAHATATQTPSSPVGGPRPFVDGNVHVVKIPYNKLVRDRIPEIIRSTGQRPVTRVLNQGDYQAALLKKLAEEAREARQAPVEELPAELADVLEVLRAIASAHGLTWDQIVAAAARKRTDRGAFDGRIFLEYVEDLPAS